MKKSENLNEKYNILQDEVITLVKYKDFLEKEIELKNLKILDLETQVLRKNQKENVPNQENSAADNSSLLGSDRKPGKICRSTGKKFSKEEYW